MKIYNIINIPQGLSPEFECDCQDEYNSGYTQGVEDQKSKLSSLSISGNGEYVSFDGVSAVTVDVPQEEIHLEPLGAVFSANGNYDIAVHSGYDGFRSPANIYVEVPQTGHTDEEMEEAFESGVTSGITEQKSKLSSISISGNGEYVSEDAGFSAITVNVPQEIVHLENLTATLSANGRYDFTVHSGYDAFNSPARVYVEVPQTGHTDQEMEDSWNSGYTSGYTDGQASVDCTDFYNSGYTDGYESGYTDGSEDGFDSGYTSGVTDGYASGYTSGKTDGFDAGYDSGVTDGYTSGKTDAWQPAYDSGYTDGAASVDCQPLYDSGYTDGYSSGRTDGYDDGWRPGYNSGYTDGINAAGGDYASGYTQQDLDNAYASGLTNGYDSGWTAGYGSGYTDGLDACGGQSGVTKVGIIYRTDDTNVSFKPTSAVTLFNEDILSAVTRMVVDGNEVTPTSVYDFTGDIGHGAIRYHAVEYYFNSTTVPDFAFNKVTHIVDATISGDCTDIGSGAFWLCGMMGSDDWNGYPGVTLSPHINLTNSDVFANCSNLKTFEVPTATTVIPSGLCYVCSGLTSLTIHSGVTEIDDIAFQQAVRLTTLTLPASITKIGRYSFGLCTGLTSVTLLSDTPPEIFTGVDSPFAHTTCVFYVPAGSVEAYKTDSGWSVYANRIQAIQ